MDGVFMRKCLKRVGFCLLLAAFVWCGTVLADRQKLSEELVRLHVVANSDSQEDQQIKLRVRDAVTQSLEQAMEDFSDVEQAKAYLRENLPKLQKLANETLRSLGCTQEAVVTLCREAFDTRYYDTFTLPAGIYEALRITIGEGEGRNWWCVVFPTFCIPATTEGVADVAAGAGFSESLNAALTGEQSYQVRFFLLDTLGKLENLFWQE